MNPSPMFHQHLVLAYAFTWAVQLGYLGYVVYRARKSSKEV